MEKQSSLNCKVLATSTGSNRAWSTILNDLYTNSSYSTFTEERKTNTIIRQGATGNVFRYVGGDNYMIITKGGNNMLVVLLNISDKKRYASTNGSSFSDATTDTSSTTFTFEEIVS